MLKRTSSFGFIIILAVALASMIWANLQFSYWGFGGKDFYVNWLGTRALIIDGKSPYNENFLFETQADISGNIPFLTAEGSVISSPLYSLLLTFPFAMIGEFVVARAIWITFSQIALIIMILGLLKITKWRPTLWEFAILFASIYMGHFAISALISGNMIIWTSLFLVLSFGALNVKRDEIAGGLLALTTFQPQIFILTNLFVIFWALTTKRRLVVFWFFGLIFIMTSVSLLFIPDWPLQYLRLLTRFVENFPYMLPRRAIMDQWAGIGLQLSWAITFGTAIILIVEGWLATGKEIRWSLWTICLILVLTRLVGIPINAMHNFVLVIPLILVYSTFQERWKNSSGWLALIIILLFLGGWIQFITMLNNPELSWTDLHYPLHIFIIIALYWVRWWAIRPPRVYILGDASR